MVEQRPSGSSGEDLKIWKRNVYRSVVNHVVKGGMALGVGCATQIVGSHIVENINLPGGNLKNILLVAPITGYTLEYLRQSVMGFREAIILLKSEKGK